MTTFRRLQKDVREWKKFKTQDQESKPKTGKDFIPLCSRREDLFAQPHCFPPLHDHDQPFDQQTVSKPSQHTQGTVHHEDLI